MIESVKDINEFYMKLKRKEKTPFMNKVAALLDFHFETVRVKILYPTYRCRQLRKQEIKMIIDLINTDTDYANTINVDTPIGSTGGSIVDNGNKEAAGTIAEAQQN